MSKEYDYEIYGQPSHLKPKERKLKVYFSEPDAGITQETGILLLVAGFGGNARSNVYKKMRSTFADDYNLVVVQCDYFGSQYMQAPDNYAIDIGKLQVDGNFSPDEISNLYKGDNPLQNMIELIGHKRLNIVAQETLGEDLSNYNEMGLIQAIDNISAVISVIEVIKDNGYEFNKEKVILYGHSQGAYLCYLCNALAPNLWTLLIDNSAWLFPGYLEAVRAVSYPFANSVLSVGFDYLARGLDIDKEILYLPSLYKKFENRCPIICYHGTDDKLISTKEKIKLKELIKDFSYNEIGHNEIDGTVFKSTEHGLGADFLAVYKHTMKAYKFKRLSRAENEDVVYKTKTHKYLVDYSKVIPILYIDKK